MDDCELDVASEESMVRSLACLSDNQSDAGLDVDDIAPEEDCRHVELDDDSSCSLASADSRDDSDITTPCMDLARPSTRLDEWAGPLPRFGSASEETMSRGVDPQLPHVPSLELALCQAVAPNRGPVIEGRRLPALSADAVPIQRIYGTVRACSITHRVGSALTQRNNYDLPKQLFFDPAWRRLHGGGPGDHAWRVSVVFAEWLMGMPPGWTSMSPLQPSALACHPVWQWPRWKEARKHRVTSLFSGMGALDFALSPWCRVVAYVEQNEDAKNILRARIADGALDPAPIHGDIRTVGSGDLPDLAGLIAGFPCTDVATPGRRRGLDGDDTVLVLEVFRLCDATRCGFVFLENVNGLRSMGAVWKRILSELAQRDFAMRWVTVACSQIGAPQRRWRWFLYGCRGIHRGLQFADPLNEPTLLPPSGLEFNAGRPPPQQWLTRTSSDNDAQLRMLGNAVVPLQGFTAARLLAAG